MADMTITSNEDDSVTLEVGGVTAHIKAPTWQEANAAAQALGGHLAAKRELRDVARKTAHIRRLAKDVEGFLESAERHARGILEVISDE